MSITHPTKIDWRKTADQYNLLAEEYDSWFEDNPLFAVEMEALRAVARQCPRPFLEIGVGPGRFAQALQTEYGIDPASSALQLAHRRNIMGIKGIGEELPVRSGSIGTVFILFTLCFLADPFLVLQECQRILKSGGHLVIGLIPKASPWGKALARKKKKGNPFYRDAQLRSVAETIEMAGMQEFVLAHACSTLFHPPGGDTLIESPRWRYDENAGFNVLVFTQKENASEITEPDHPDH